MYPKIYKRNETDFSHNGEGFLKDLIKCEVVEEDNGMFELEGQCTISSFLFEQIEEENIIKAWASEELGEQLFRIYRVQKDLDGYITFNAQHISYDLLDNFIESIEIIDVTCENAINEIFNNCAYETPFKGYSDITHKGSIVLQRVNPMEAIKGTRGSICDTFSNGPKVIKDNFNIKVMANRGSNNNVLIAYKKNLIGFESEIDISDLVTAIFPYATIQIEGDKEGETSEKTIQLPERYIYSEYHKNYNNLKITPMDFSGDDVTDIESLRKRANNYFKNSNCDIPNVNYKVEFIPLSKTVNYADYKVLEDVSMCDTVIIRDYRFNLNIEAQVIKTTHCSLTKKLLSCELGNFKYSMSNIVSDINKNQEEIIDKVDKIKIDVDSEVGRLEINIKDEVSKLESNIELTAEKLESTFTDANNNLQSQITQNAGEIRTELKDTKNNLESSISQTAERLESTFTDANNNLQSQIIQNAKDISQRVTGPEFESYKTQTDKEISQKVSNGEIISSINQTAESIKINASKISLEGTVTANNNFIINNDGSMTANGCSINGKITSSQTINAYGGIYTGKDIRGYDPTGITGGLTLVTGTGNLALRTENSPYSVYLQSATGEVKVTAPSDPNTFNNLRAYDLIANNKVYANGVALTSNIDKKKNIEDYTESALNEICTTPIRKYHLKDDLDDELKRIGVIVQEAPLNAIDLSGEGVDLYQMITMSWKAIQELKEEIDKLKTNN